MKKHALVKNSLIAALDIGSSKIACFIARVTDDRGGLEVVGIGYQASKGIKAGMVVDLAAAEASVRQAVHHAENMAAEALKGYPLREVIINIPGVHSISTLAQVDVQVLGQEVTNHDVQRALAKAQSEATHPDYELLHTIPVGYGLDGYGAIREPRGLIGQHLGVDIHMVLGANNALKNLAATTERSHLDIVALCSSIYASGISCLVEDELNLGATVIDMGGGITSLGIFYDGQLLYTDAVPLGGQNVTNDIARGLMTTWGHAERLKTLYGSAIATVTDDVELIDVPPLGEEDHYQPNHVPRSLLIGIIQPRLEEILEIARAKMHDTGLMNRIGRRVVLTGGASQLPGLRDLAQRLLDKQVRLGRPARIQGLAEAVSGPAFSTTAGLLQYMSERADELPAAIMQQAAPRNVWERVQVWLKENW
ncbi:MAG: cell division protein FtsA [Alphaproteobacteria bacterium]|nr:cell division protein FtsA [Alphaproteobacteria bacterium]